MRPATRRTIEYILAGFIGGATYAAMVLVLDVGMFFFLKHSGLRTSFPIPTVRRLIEHLQREDPPPHFEE